MQKPRIRTFVLLWLVAFRPIQLEKFFYCFALFWQFSIKKLQVRWQKLGPTCYDLPLTSHGCDFKQFYIFPYLKTPLFIISTPEIVDRLEVKWFLGLSQSGRKFPVFDWESDPGAVHIKVSTDVNQTDALTGFIFVIKKALFMQFTMIIFIKATFSVFLTPPI